jgi:PAS domain S-box-containing protein
MTSVDAEVKRLGDHPQGLSRAPSTKNEKRLHDLLHALPAAVYTTDATGRITYYNRAAAELWGSEPMIGAAEWNGGSWKLFWPDGTPLPRAQSLMAIALKEKHAVRGMEAIAERSDGTCVPFVLFPTPLRNDEGEIVGAVNMLVDITEHKHSEEIAQRLAAIVESSDDAIISKDLNGIITSWNRGAERIFGYTPEEVIGKPVTVLIPPERHDEEPAILERLRRGERIDHYETIRMRKNGSRIDISLTVSPIRNAAGKVIGASKIARDITERKRGDVALRRAEEKLRDFIENASVSMHGVGPDGIIIWANRTEMEMLGFTPEEYIGHHIAEFHADQQVIEDILRRLTNRETLVNYESSLRCKDGSIRHALINSNVYWEDDKFIHTRCFTRDITEHKQNEARITILAREAEHRAKNVLATVQASVRLSQSDTPDGLRKAIDGRIQALANVHRLFAESRWSGAELHTMVEQELAAYCPDKEGRARINGPKLLLEPSKAQTIAVTLHELATNAAKYGALSVRDGRVEVEWSIASDGQLVLRWRETGGPPIESPTRRGFGTRVMDGMIRQLNGEMRFDWHSDGLTCEIAFPAI